LAAEVSDDAPNVATAGLGASEELRPKLKVEFRAGVAEDPNNGFTSWLGFDSAEEGGGVAFGAVLLSAPNLKTLAGEPALKLKARAGF